jgi:hypothetical protein
MLKLIVWIQVLNSVSKSISLSGDGWYECRYGRPNVRKDSGRETVDIFIELVNDIESLSIDHRLSLTLDEL